MPNEDGLCINGTTIFFMDKPFICVSKILITWAKFRYINNLKFVSFPSLNISDFDSTMSTEFII